ncbi:DUF1640 domain-containing protein [Gallibacterium anatis]|uniref:DUF1640 domain-containing protein n=1 Tax=Gallibacterium anatis TaxID=750 RepID=UPI001B323263|nr:DUF1640 domain-containing protein [Gallibacterium anatis]MBP4132384.1 DUF1640 domain-containing protein [Gallibacterium anatis]WIM84968.1 DUF1640 domain-containing protein [Gallibacterium anatis]
MDNTMRLNFDKLVFTQKLTAKGYTQEQSEALAEAVDGAITQSNSALATVEDLNAVKTELRTEINEVRTELKTEINEVRTELRAGLQGLKADFYQAINRLTFALIGSVIAIIGALLANKFF